MLCVISGWADGALARSCVVPNTYPECIVQMLVSRQSTESKQYDMTDHLLASFGWWRTVLTIVIYAACLTAALL